MLQRNSLWLLANLIFTISLPSLTTAIWGANRTCNVREYPFMVGIFRSPVMDGALNITCGGSLVHPKVVLTAASCIDGQNGLYAAVGLWLTHPVLIEVEYIRLHPGWLNQEKRIKDNIGVMILKDEVRGIKLLRLPKRKIQGEFQNSCPYAEIISMGEKEPGQKVDLRREPFSCGKMRVIHEDNCKQAYPVLGELFFKTVICTYNKNNSMGVFRSDAGSPLICGSIQIGVVSFAIRYKMPLPNVFTRVDYYVKWIRNKFPKSSKSQNEGTTLRMHNTNRISKNRSNNFNNNGAIARQGSYYNHNGKHKMIGKRYDNDIDGTDEDDGKYYDLLEYNKEHYNSHHRTGEDDTYVNEEDNKNYDY